MCWMHAQAERWGAELLTEDVEFLDLSQRPFTIRTSDTEVRPGCPGWEQPSRPIPDCVYVNPSQHAARSMQACLKKRGRDFQPGAMQGAHELIACLATPQPSMLTPSMQACPKHAALHALWGITKPCKAAQRA